MSQFSYEQYQNVVAQAQANGEGTKIGYFKLKDDGDIAIARLNLSSTDDFMFASVHTLKVGANKWMKVSCLNPLGVTGGSCGLCSAHAANPNGVISKAAKKLFVPMMVSYRDAASATGYTVPIPVIWDRPASFSRELANKLMIAGDLRNTLVLITRNGKAGDMQTTYSVDILPETHPVFKPDMIPADFSAFTNFNIARHSYWEKTGDEISTYLSTGQFPEANQAVAPAANAGIVTQQPFTAPTAPVTETNPAPQQSEPAPAPVAPQLVTGDYVQPQASATPVVAPEQTSGTPVRNFTGFSF